MNVAREVLVIVTFFNVFKQQNVPMGELITREKASESAKKLNMLELRTSEDGKTTGEKVHYYYLDW